MQRGPASRNEIFLAAQKSRTRSRGLKKSTTKGSPAQSSGKTADQKSVACFPRTGSRLSVSRISRPTAFTSAPRSSASTSSENAGRSSAPLAAAPLPGPPLILLLPAWGISRENLGSACAHPASQRTHPDFPARYETSWRSLLFRRVCALLLCDCGQSFRRGACPDGRFPAPAPPPPFLRAP